MRKTFFAIFGTMIFCSCTSPVNVLKPFGESASLRHIDARYRGELIAVNDSMLVLEYNAKLYAVPLSEAKHVYIHDYSLKNIKTVPMVLVTGINIVLLGHEIASEDGGPPGIIIFGLLTYLGANSISSGDPKVDFSPPLGEKDLKKLKLYSRYPQGLTQQQWRELLQHYGQKDFQRLTPGKRDL